LFEFIASEGYPETADEYIAQIIDYCESLSTFPHRGNKRDDIRRGLRTTNYRGRVVIAFTVIDETVVILGVYYGGRNFERDLSDLA
jgi:plasmid stabilization system protein ParE